MKFRCVGLTERNTLRFRNANKFNSEINIIIICGLNLCELE